MFSYVTYRLFISIPSNRRLIEDVKYHVSYRWFCGLALDSPLPSPSSLSRFFKRLSFRVFQSFFNAILNQCEQAGLLNNKSIITDSTLFQANASLNSLAPNYADIKRYYHLYPFI
ncbi:transposase [Legionella gresilensis]|uniref:transposase n=1 Tax=Legionella gresilensis TaxID=91823 RepID=UPI0013EF8E87